MIPIEELLQMTDTNDKAAEFASVILTIDHTTQPTANGHLLQKFVASTEDLVTSMVSLIDYYKEPHLMQAATIRQFQEAHVSEFPAFVYRTPENIQVVMDAQTFTMLVGRNEGNVLKATQHILNTAGQIITENDEAAGGVMPLLLFSWEFGEVEQAEAAE